MMTNRIFKYFYRSLITPLIYVIYLFILSGCFQERVESPTKGTIFILVSESISPMMKQEFEKFEELYPDAKISSDVTTTRDAIVQFFNHDTLKMIVTSRPLNAEERNYAKEVLSPFKEYKIATGGVAIIVNKHNPINELRITELDSIFRGVITTWKYFGWSDRDSKIAICVPDQNSGVFEVVREKILKNEKFQAAAKTEKSSPEIFKFVMEKRSAIGVVGINWLRYYRDSVKTIKLSDPYAPDSLGINGQYFGPHQAYIYLGYYALSSDAYIYSRADPYSVGAGIISFITSATGQKIVLDNGLVPATMPIRLVEITNRGI